MGTTRTAGSACTTTAAACPGERPAAAGGIEQGQLALRVLALAVSAGGFHISVFDGTYQFEFRLAFLADVLINRH